MMRQLRCGTVALLVALLGCTAVAEAQHAGDMLLGSSANGGGSLKLVYDFTNKVVVSASFSGGGITLSTTTDPGFDALIIDDPGNAFYALDSGTQVRVQITAIDAPVSMKFGATTLDAVGESALLGAMPNLHVHPEWRLTLPTGMFGTYAVSFKLTTTSASYSESVAYTAMVTNIAPTATPTSTLAPASATPTSTATATPTATSTPTATVPAAATCPPAPLVCATTGAAKLQLKAPLGEPGKRLLLWKWLKGTIADAATFGDPTDSTSFALCIYDDGVLLPPLPLAAAGTCDGRPCWKAAGANGYAFGSKSGTAQGVTKVILKAGAGNAKIIIRGKGGTLPVPAADPLFAQSSAVTVQLVNDAGACWGTAFAPPAKANDAELFKDQTP